jgi:hypothetical protein
LTGAASPNPELAFGQDVGDDRVDPSQLTEASSTRELGREGAQRLDREPENRATASKEVGDRATSGSNGRNYV